MAHAERSGKARASLAYRKREKTLRKVVMLLWIYFMRRENPCWLTHTNTHTTWEVWVQFYWGLLRTMAQIQAIVLSNEKSPTLFDCASGMPSRSSTLSWHWYHKDRQTDQQCTVRWKWDSCRCTQIGLEGTSELHHGWSRSSHCPSTEYTYLSLIAIWKSVSDNQLKDKEKDPSLV